MHRCLLILRVLLLALPSASFAQEVAFRGFDTNLSYVALDGGPQIGIDGFGAADYRQGRWLGLQADAGLQYLGNDSAGQAAAAIALHPYLRVGAGLSVGAYLMGWAAEDPTTSYGLEASWQPASRFSAELYFGETYGDELTSRGHATNKGAMLGYTFADDIHGEVYFRKDTTSEHGKTDRDYYDYGLGIDTPVGANGATRLTAELGQIRLDAEGSSSLRISLGLSRQVGGTRNRPTFSRKRSVLTELLGF